METISLEEFKELNSLQNKNIQSSSDIQVGGHPEAIIFLGDKICKLAKNSEIEFYSWLFGPTSSNMMKKMIDFIPKYYGVSDIQGNKYLVLENLNYDSKDANLMDCKLGKITWSRNNSPAKIERKKLHNLKSTTNLTGFRVCGMIIKDQDGEINTKIDKGNSYQIIKDKNDLVNYFRKFISINEKINKNVQENIIIQIKNFLSFFKNQNEKKFLATSIYFVIGKNNKIQIKLIDFANIDDSDGELDDNIIEALEGMLSIWESL